ncbi:adenosine deaminase family protein [Tepidimonas sp.]|uniref:adenosine deaminase family protein n=1 Tax=Tepidimonas sp. TaxID=2002775 RepID=UPI00391C5853
MPDELRGHPDPALFTAALPAALARAVMPVVVGQGQADESLQVPDADGVVVSGEHFPLPLPESVIRWRPARGERLLSDEIARRQRQGARLVRNFVSTMTAGDVYPNWPGLLRLSPPDLDRLRKTVLTAEHRALLQRLPKVDLHRHLGGCLDLAGQRRVGQSLWEAMSRSQQQSALEELRALGWQQGAEWPDDWPSRLRRSGQRAALCAALLVHNDEGVLRQQLYGSTQPRVALKRRHPEGFSAYERPGELMGSAGLSEPAALPVYAQEVVRLAREEGLAALELRGSPHKYDPADPVDFVYRLREALLQAGARVGTQPGAAQEDLRNGPHVGFLWILDRRNHAGAAKIVEAAVRAHAELAGFVVGLDLAGDEAASSPQAWSGMFAPAFRECMFITVHAGEDEPAENIWEAAYHMHADRIGHGLTLHDNPRLMARFRERGICLELCPTSNLEVVGYRDPVNPQTEELPVYPLRTLMRAGLPLTLCTDNPGISCTTLVDEYITASRIVPDGLTLWEALALMRQGFERTFLPAPVRTALMHAADQAVIQALEESW